jgi:hypothetical protein
VTTRICAGRTSNLQHAELSRRRGWKPGGQTLTPRPADLIERNCRFARRFAEALQQGGCEILNEVVLNQVLVSFGEAARTREVIERVQRDGTCWCGPTEWQGRAAMRISVSS